MILCSLNSAFILIYLTLNFISFSYYLGRVALQRELVYKGPSVYFTIQYNIVIESKTNTYQGEKHTDIQK